MFLSLLTPAGHGAQELQCFLPALWFLIEYDLLAVFQGVSSVRSAVLFPILPFRAWVKSTIGPERDWTVATLDNQKIPFVLCLPTSVLLSKYSLNSSYVKAEVPIRHLPYHWRELWYWNSAIFQQFSNYLFSILTPECCEELSSLCFWYGFDMGIIACSCADVDVAVNILVPELGVLLEPFVVILITILSAFKWCHDIFGNSSELKQWGPIEGKKLTTDSLSHFLFKNLHIKGDCKPLNPLHSTSKHRIAH